MRGESHACSPLTPARSSPQGLADPNVMGLSLRQELGSLSVHSPQPSGKVSPVVFPTWGLHPPRPRLVLGLTAQGQILLLSLSPSSPGKRLGSGGCFEAKVTGLGKSLPPRDSSRKMEWGDGLRKLPSPLIQLGSRRLSAQPHPTQPRRSPSAAQLIALLYLTVGDAAPGQLSRTVAVTETTGPPAGS